MPEIVVCEDGTRRAGCDESSGWVWHSAHLLETALVEEFHDLSSLSILELGSGTGWLALRLALRGAKVTATDRPGALQLLQRNVFRNQDRLESENATIASKGNGDSAVGEPGTSTDHIRVPNLDVDVQTLEWETDGRLVGSWDAVVASDVLYMQENYLALLQTILRHDCKLCILTWEQRKLQEEEHFLVLAKQAGFQVEPLVLAGVNPVTGNPIWLLRMTVAVKSC